VPFYERQGKLVRIDGMKPIDDVSQAIADALAPKAKGGGFGWLFYMAAAALFWIGAAYMYGAQPQDLTKPVVGIGLGLAFAIWGWRQRVRAS
jgi:hypothetical protein